MKHCFLIKLKHCVIIYFIYFQERSNAKLIPETQGPLTPGKKTKNDLNFKENNLKLQYCVILKLELETFLNYFKNRNLRNQKVRKFKKSGQTNPFLANVPILYPLKTPEKQRFSNVFKRYKLGTLARYGLR